MLKKYLIIISPWIIYTWCKDKRKKKLFNESGLNEKINTYISNKIRNEKISSKELKAKHDEIEKFQTHGLSLFIGHSYLANDGAQLQWILQPVYHNDTEKVVSWKSKGFSTEKLTTPTTNENGLSISIKWYRDSNFCLIFKRSYSKQWNATGTFPNR